MRGIENKVGLVDRSWGRSKGDRSVTEEPRYTRIARFYDLLNLPFEYLRYRPIRRILFRGVRGVVLDAGVGTGRNMPFYPGDGEVVGIDLSPRMLARARWRKERLGAEVALREMDVRATGFPDGRFDFVVATFLFCVLGEDDQQPALSELRRICKPGGEIRILEYTYSTRPVKRFVMRLWAPWVRLMYGAAFDRHTERYVTAAGLRLIDERFVFQDIIKLLVLTPE
jgi:ubiquinone/menaquinone biosynthesis C-methylase UbiE